MRLTQKAHVSDQPGSVLAAGGKRALLGANKKGQGKSREKTEQFYCPGNRVGGLWKAMELKLLHGEVMG